ncbi:uncharacterized protein C8R40DRAFT_787003 [Lentinula edodes]|uniref:uncharacterized protein n=1 Tax=Lentinula edodes TaxID=5353 RepID=UPI001E8D97B2|nr:uncharacterized protein C8R40DRAFT_787003 [Lentinula edodes]KAH7878745.1 hypothetical protein C8R40DRAFT_787003 [Lentinula edodes]
MTTASDVSKKENPSLLDDTAEELKEPGTKTQVAVEGQRSGADISEGPDKKEEIGTEVDEKDWDDDIKPTTTSRTCQTSCLRSFQTKTQVNSTALPLQVSITSYNIVFSPSNFYYPHKARINRCRLLSAH